MQTQTKTVPYCNLHKYIIEPNKIKVKCRNKYLQEKAGNPTGICKHLKARGVK